MEKEGETTNDMILQQPLPKIPILEKFEREASLKSKFIIDQPLRTSTDSWKEEENHKTNDMSHILTLEKLESHFIKSKLMVGQENGILSPWIMNSHKVQVMLNLTHLIWLIIFLRVGQNSSESMFNISQKFNEYTQGFGYSNEAFTSRSLSSRKENEDGAPGELQSTSWNIQDSHFNTTTNCPWAPNSYMNIIDHQDLYSSTIPRANEFDFGEEAELSKIFDITLEHHVNTTIISKLPNIVPEEQQLMTTTNISSNSSSDKNSLRITYPIILDDDDDYSLLYIYSAGLKNVSMLREDGVTSPNVINQENPKTLIPMSIVMEK
ncbi:hypothetical protein H5410_004612 [Solanum commersonii]|uniref:Uncharacterized protein n=1 Tax=Solanum commersonii TaxID=4109 RepID=A0A9J6B8W6_SOLCO|nr:hypothetical protein H5410_004612 [Solanum commersonii]